MSRKNPITRRALLVMTTGFVGYARSPPAAAASERDNTNRPRISIAVPEFSGDSVSDEVSPRDITEIVVSDLKASGRFVLVEPNGSIEEKVDAVPQFTRWRDLNTECLVIGRIARRPDQHIFVEFRLWNVVSGQQLVGAQYGLQPEDWRRVPHAVVQAILERLTG
jgi:TolB protein